MNMYVYTDNLQTNCSAVTSCVSVCFLPEVQLRQWNQSQCPSL